MNATKQLLLSLTVILMTGICATSFAQDQPAGEAAENPQAAAEAKAPEEETQGSEEAARMTDEITVWGEGRRETNYVSPDSLLVPEDLVAVTAATTEDLVKYEPSIIIRRRYVGDPNGTVGMRGSNMFQTPRTMVFADGIPLHYFLETRFNGSPRWGLVNADEVGFVEVVYGPFSAEYGGNAMGGVINIETSIPAERHLRAQGSFLDQTFDERGFDDSMQGFRGFLSYGEKRGKLSLYGALNVLQNDSQPLDYNFGATRTSNGTEVAASGSLLAVDAFGDPVRYFGNTGQLDSRTEQLKLKLGYELPAGWFALFNIGFEARDIARDSPHSYLRTAGGRTVWSGAVVEDGVAFSVPGSSFSVSDQERRTLLLGGRVQGMLSDDWHLEASISYFDILEDESRSSLLNPADPLFTPAGTVRDFDQAGWETAEVKLQNDRLAGRADLSLVTGYRFEHYSLGVSNYTSDDYAAGLRTALSNASGGESLIHAAFAQVAWAMSPAWDVTLGGRFESWESSDGFFNDNGNLQHHADRSESRFSPKLSIGYQLTSDWRFRLSSAMAFRFPIVEELFQNERRTTGTSIANADLEPEDGLHYNLMIERSVVGGHVRVNLFTETIDDVIFNQTSIVDNRSITTFLPIDEVVTDGLELIYNQSALLRGNLAVRFNATYLDSRITENRANPAFEGKVFPRMPKWRSHLLLNYRIHDRWDVGGGIQYSSDSFDDLENSDTAERVFGAHDAFTRLNLRTGFQVNETLRLSLGIDNLTNEITYVHHPWPGRTMFLEFSVGM